MKLAEIMPIFKKGHKCNLSNGPISVMRKKMIKILSLFLSNYNIISDSQYGFKAKASTCHAGYI